MISGTFLRVIDAGRAVSQGLAWVLGVLLLLIASPTQGADAPAVRKLSQYEEESVQIALRRVEGERELDPEGKRIESIEIVALDMIDDRDVLPNFLNVFHYTTRDYVIRREVLLKEGQSFELALADETERNLRVLPQFTIVLVVSLKGSRPDSVRVLVVTKDVLSLRLESDPRFYNGKLYYLSLQPSERNLLGTHHTVSGLAIFTPHNYSVGASLYFPRIANSRINGTVTAGATINCDTGKAEGHFGSFSYGQPLYTTRTRWAWDTSMSWIEGVYRPTRGEWICSGGAESPYQVYIADRRVTIPERYNYNQLRGSTTITRSFGVDQKFNVAFGVEALRDAFFVDEPDLSEVTFEQVVRDDTGALIFNGEDYPWQSLTPLWQTITPDDPGSDVAAATDSFRTVRPPRGDTRISPFVQFFAFRNRFNYLLNYNTLGMQEDLRLEHVFSLKLYPALRAWGSTRNLFGIASSMGYTLPVGNGFFNASSSSWIEASATHKSNATVDGALRFASPDRGFGRLVLAGYVVRRLLNYSNGASYLGGTGRLRGYQPDVFRGPHMVVGNAEYRTPPFEILSVQVAGALFYDVGDAFLAPSTMHLRSGAGAGLRFGFPQLQRDVFRIDAGFPLTNSQYGEMTIVAAFGQAL